MGEKKIGLREKKGLNWGKKWIGERKDWIWKNKGLNWREIKKMYWGGKRKD